MIKKTLYMIIVCVIITFILLGSSNKTSITFFPSGIYDATFNNGNPGVNNLINAMILQSDGKIVICGYFTSYGDNDTPDRIIRLNSDGSLDLTFNKGGAGADSSISVIALQSDGKIVIGGCFSEYNGVDVPDNLLRLNADGTVDNTFNYGGLGANDGNIRAIEELKNKKILICGSFTSYNGTDIPYQIMRLNADGTVDSSFNIESKLANNFIRTLKIQNNGKILISGNFTIYNEINIPARIIRLNTDGSIDSAFNIGFTSVESFIFDMELQGDGKILLGGNFTEYNGVDVSDCIMRINSNGIIDPGFNPSGIGANNYIFKIIILHDRKILITGEFTKYNEIDVPDYLIRLK